MCLDIVTVKHPGTENTTMVAWKVMRQHAPGQYKSIVVGGDKIYKENVWHEAEETYPHYWDEEQNGYKVGFHAYKKKSDAWKMENYYATLYMRVVKVKIRKWTAFGKQAKLGVVVGRELMILGEQA